MKRTNYVYVAAALMAITACTGGPSNTFTITGSIAGTENGDTVFLQKIDKRNLVMVDTAIIADGSFQFKGQEDSIANRFITWNQGDGITNLYVEKGNIKVSIDANTISITGTRHNDAFQEYRTELNKLRAEGDSHYAVLSDMSASEEDKQKAAQAYQELREKSEELAKTYCIKNITNAVGVDLYKQINYGLDYDERVALLNQIPATFKQDSELARIQTTIEKIQKTAPGKTYLDFSMKDMKGNDVKLSDYVGKGKVVLVDFWASWCGPCRREMPFMVDLYKKYGKQVEFVGVSLDNDEEAWKNAYKNLNMSWPQMSDLKGWKSVGAQSYGVNSIPHIVIIDKDGTIAARGLRGETLVEKIEELIK